MFLRFRSGLLLITTFCTSALMGAEVKPSQNAAAPASPKAAPATPVLPPAPKSPLAVGDGSFVFTFQQRWRFDWRENNFDFNDSLHSATDDAWLMQRTRLGFKWEAARWLRIAAEMQDVREFGSERPDIVGPTAEGDDRFDLRQFSIDVGDPNGFSVKIGRQLLSYGDERLVGPLEWLNQSRSFDAVKLRYQQPTFWIEAFTSSVVNPRDKHFNQSDWLDANDTRNQFFSGAYFSTTALDFQRTDVYLYHLHQEGINSADFVTLGTLWKGDPKKLRGWDYTVEMVGQNGRVNNTDLTAFAGHWQVGYNWLKAAWKPRLGVEYSYGSGDNNPNDGKTTTFQNLFPTNHPPYGFMDAWSWQNVHNLVLRSSIQPHAKIKATADFHLFWLADTGDAWNRANATTRVRPITPGASNFAGSELDFTVLWKPKPYLDVLLGYSHFFAGAYLADTGASDDADFAYMMVTVNF